MHDFLRFIEVWTFDFRFSYTYSQLSDYMAGLEVSAWVSSKAFDEASCKSVLFWFHSQAQSQSSLSFEFQVLPSAG